MQGMTVSSLFIIPNYLKLYSIYVSKVLTSQENLVSGFVWHSAMPQII